MERLITRDELTPAYVEAYKRWKQDGIDRYRKRHGEQEFERLSHMQIKDKDSGRWHENLPRQEHEVVMSQLYQEFCSRFNSYQPDLQTFWGAYMHHPISLKLGYEIEVERSKLRLKEPGWLPEEDERYLDFIYEKISSFAPTPAVDGR